MPCHYKAKYNDTVQLIAILMQSTDIISVYLYKWEASSHQPVPMYADPVYAEMTEGSTLEACKKADRMEICERNT